MPDFTSPEELIEALQIRIHEAMPGLPEYTEVAKLIADDARGRLGQYQDGSPPFEGWAPLTDETMDAREKLGYTRDDPLLRSGTLRDHIVEAPSEMAALVLVPSEMVEVKGESKPVNIGDIADYLEKGTPSIPPRPFLGPALISKRLEAMAIIQRKLAESTEK